VVLLLALAILLLQLSVFFRHLLGCGLLVEFEDGVEGLFVLFFLLVCVREGVPPGCPPKPKGSPPKNMTTCCDNDS
jgi:hypothetical protein